jgi:hypothetical protein
MKAKALRSILPSIKAELSLVNSLVELKDLKTVNSTLKAAAKAPGLFDPKLWSTLAKSGKTLRQILRSSSNVYLQFAFNVLPMLSDISGIQTALKNYKKRINALVSQSGIRQSRHFSLTVPETNTFEVSPYYYNVDGVFTHPYISARKSLTRFVAQTPSLFHAQIEYNINYLEYQVRHAEVLGLLDMLGVNLNPQIIWNAIPWSFVVDWVAKVGDFLSRYKTDNMEPMINIHRFLWSYKRQRTIYLTNYVRALNPTLSPGCTSKNQLPSVTETSYKREVGEPTTGSVELSGLNSTEFSLGAALVLVQGKGIKH